MKKVVILTIVVCLAVMFILPVPLFADTEECLAAPAVAGLLLENAGIDNRYGTGKDGGNYIKEVANHMGPDTDFNGVSKCDVEAYKIEVANFLGVIIGPDLFRAELESVVYEGTCNLFGTHIDDTITFTFSNDVVHVPDVEVKFQTAQRLWEGWGADEWTVSGNVATLSLIRLYDSPRDVIGDKVISITGLVDFIGNPVVVPSGGVEVEGIVTYDLVGDWKLDLYIGDTLHERFIIIASHSNGDIIGFLGVGYDPSGAPTGEITGTLDGDSISMLYDREGYSVDGYTAEFEGTIDDCNSMSGIWSDYARINEPWTMTRQ